jgi:hypothetical protein
MEFTIKIYNPIEKIKIWFKYHKIFWRVHELELERLGFYDLEKEKYYIYFIRHIVTGRVVSYGGWGDKLHQRAIYQVNKEYKLYEKSSKKFYRKEAETNNS